MDALQVGRAPRPQTEGLTVKALANEFLNHKKALRETGELSRRSRDGYKETCGGEAPRRPRPGRGEGGGARAGSTTTRAREGGRTCRALPDKGGLVAGLLNRSLGPDRGRLASERELLFPVLHLLEQSPLLLRARRRQGAAPEVDVLPPLKFEVLAVRQVGATRASGEVALAT